jgi:hypothetical protein
VEGGPPAELAAAGELTGADGAALLSVAAGALLAAGALVLGATEAEADDAELDDAACGLELLVHPANASDTDTVTATDDHVLERDNRDISQE